eukprot:s1053_g10.t1
MASKPLPGWVAFSTSGVGGIFGWIFIHPVNTLAIRMNLASMQNPGAKLNFFSFASQTVKTTGIMGLYDGLGAGIWRQIFYASSRYGLFQVFRDTLAKYREVDFASRLACATAAGGMAALISCPCEVSLVRLSNDATLEPSMRRNYKGVVDCARRIAQEEGVTAFWRGSTPFVTRACLVGATQTVLRESVWPRSDPRNVMTNRTNMLHEFWSRESGEFRNRMTETTGRSAYARDTRDPPRGRSPSREDAEVGYTPRSVRSFQLRQLRSFSEPHMASTKSLPCDSLAVTPRRSEVPSVTQTPRIRVAAQHLPINGHPNQVPLSSVQERRCFSKGSKGSTGPTGPTPRSKSSGLSHKSAAVGSVRSIPSEKFVQWLGATPVFAGWRSRSKPASNEGYAQKHQRRQNSTPATPVGAPRQVLSPKALTKSSPMPKPIRPTTTGLSARLVNAETLKAENAALREELARANLAPLMQPGDVGSEVQLSGIADAA